MTYRLGVDIGGTFTDLVVLDESNGQIQIAKAPTTPQAPIEGVLGAVRKRDINLADVSLFVHGTTAATNAVVQRRGAKVGLITTKGFRDTLDIMRCNREHHYDLQWDKPQPMVPRYLRLEVPERIDYRGRVVRPLDESAAREVVRRLKQEQVEAIAICFIFSFMNPAHEQRMKEIVKDEWPEVFVSVSSEILPEIREYERTSTVVIDAYVKPLINRYFRSLEDGLRAMGLRSDLMIMGSGGGMLPSQAAREIPVYTLSSGPAGGVIGTVFYGEQTGLRNLIAIDMGGTSFDVSLVDNGEPRYHTEGEVVWGIPFKIPLIDVRSIGAGGGSIAWVDPGGHLRVGPQSAGSEPGPVCYDAGGTEPTITDAYLTLGVVDPNYFLGGEKTLNKAASEQAIAKLGEQLGLSMVETAQGIVDIAHANMVGALHNVSISQGYDPRDFTLLAYGGAGPMVATALAQELAIQRVLVPLYPGAFSAFGMLAADMRFDFVHSYLARLEDVDLDKIQAIYDDLEQRGLENLRQIGFQGTPILVRSADLRYVGQNFEINAPVPSGKRLTPADLPTIIDNFNREHEKLYGHSKIGEPVEFVSLRVTAIGTTEKPELRTLPSGDGSGAFRGKREVYFKQHGDFIACPLYERTLLPAGFQLEGPAIIEEIDSTVLIGPEQHVTVDQFGNLVIEVAQGGAL